MNDHLGSPRLRLGSSRQVEMGGEVPDLELLGITTSWMPKNPMDYTPFGRELAQDNSDKTTPDGYTGKPLDTTFGLQAMNYGARFYDPRLGRWWQRDAWEEKNVSESPYCFVKNSPFSMIDPDGNDAVYIVFPDRDIHAGPITLNDAGHAGILLIDDRTGRAAYYEYGRYKVGGAIRGTNKPLPNVVMDKNSGKATSESLSGVLKVLSESVGHDNERIEGAYVDGAEFDKMMRYIMVSIFKDGGKEGGYGIKNNNCGNFAIRVIKVGGVDVPDVSNPKPSENVGEMQDNFEPVSFDPSQQGGD